MIKEYPRQEVLDGVKQVVAFLEANPECDIPESMGEFWIRTLVRQNRGELTSTAEVAEWSLRQLKALQPIDETYSGEHFIAIKKFGGGVILKLWIGTGEVCEITTEKQTISHPVEVEESTWHVPEELAAFGFVPDQEKLRQREREMKSAFASRKG